MKFIYIIVLCISFLFSVEFNIQPYLQNATPYSINIMWETNSGSQSLVNYGVDMNLDFNANGDSFISQGSNMIHDVYLGNLIPNTRYYYQVITLDAVSEIYDFITPPLQDSENSFKLIALKILDETLLLNELPIFVTTGRPVHSASLVVVCPV